MSWLGRLFRVVPKEELEGVSLCMTEPYWELDGPRTLGELLTALKNWVPDGAILYFEGGYPDAEILNFMATSQGFSCPGNVGHPDEVGKNHGTPYGTGTGCALPRPSQ